MRWSLAVALLLTSCASGPPQYGIDSPGFASLRVELPCTAATSPDWKCQAGPGSSAETVFQGDPAKTYAVQIRVRGVVELRIYNGGTPLDGGWLQGGDLGGHDGNVWALRASNHFDPYFINGDVPWAYCVPLNGLHTLYLKGMERLTLSVQSMNNEQTKNVGQNGAPLVVSDVPPSPAAFDGQFVQVDFVSADEES